MSNWTSWDPNDWGNILSGRGKDAPQKRKRKQAKENIALRNQAAEQAAAGLGEARVANEARLSADKAGVLGQAKKGRRKLY